MIAARRRKPRQEGGRKDDGEKGRGEAESDTDERAGE
jgi:hypothetical protein